MQSYIALTSETYAADGVTVTGTADPVVYPLDTPEQVEAARAALRAADEKGAHVHVGDAADPDSYRTDMWLAASPDDDEGEEIARVSDMAFVLFPAGRIAYRDSGAGTELLSAAEERELRDESVPVAKVARGWDWSGAADPERANRDTRTLIERARKALGGDE